MKERLHSYVLLSRGSNSLINCTVALQTVDQSVQLVQNEKTKADKLCTLREKRMELSLRRFTILKEINEVWTGMHVQWCIYGLHTKTKLSV